MAISTRFITGIRWYKGLLETLNNMTYVYDPSWQANNSVKATFPVCFFHVKSYHETMTSEISQKQMLFYNSSLGESDADPALDSGLLNVVADNIVTKPKTYKLDVIIPYHNLTLLNQSFVYNTFTSQAIAYELTKLNTEDNQKFKALGAYSTLSQPYLNLIKYLVSSLINRKYAEGGLEEWISNTAHQPDYNKESLELMWRMRHIVKMKMWNSWQYKYVAIVDVDITKEGTEDGVYEATLTVQEMPIVTMYAQGAKSATQYIRKSPALQLTGEKVINALDKASDTLGRGQ